MALPVKAFTNSDRQWIEHVVACRPASRRLTLLEAFKLSRVELPQSLYFAWLLGSRGPVVDYWLLKHFFKTFLPDQPWPGVPPSVLPEFGVESERPEFVIDWPGFKLIIEYKVDSDEGVDQVKRYLDTFGIRKRFEGAVIFLTPDG